MKITAIETWHTKIPFSQGSKPVALGAAVPAGQMHTLWVRVITDTGLEGWGEGFGHACVPATRTAFDTQIGPAALGQDARDIRGIFRRFNQMFHIFGRNGPITYALSALDIAVGFGGESRGTADLAAAGGNILRQSGGLCQPAALWRVRAGGDRVFACRGAGLQAYQTA